MKGGERDYVVHSAKKHALLFLGLITFVYAIFMPDAEQWFTGYLKILSNQAYLVHDFIEIGGISATFINVALHFFIAYYLLLRNEFTDLYGLQIAGIGIFVGHAFFGSNVLNVLPIIIGVSLYAKWSKHSLKRYTAISLLSCAMAPIISFIMFYKGFHWQSFLAGAFVGIVIGFISTPLAEEFVKFHKGYTLYNFGFTTGMIAMLVISFFSYFNYEITPVYLLSTHAHIYLVIYSFMIIFIIMGVSFIRWGEILVQYPKLLQASGRTPSDFVSTFGLSTTLFNMSFNTLLFLVFLLNTGFSLNGTLIGGLLSIMGFSAFGKHPKNCISVAVGVLLAGMIKGVGIANQGVLLTMLFSTGLAPMAVYYGAVVGIITGFIHSNLTGIVMNLHLGMSLYNNGFTSAFVAALLVPIADTIFRYKEDEDI